MRKRFGYGCSGKLVRDRAIERVLQEDSTSVFSYKYLEPHELQVHLLNKLQEEVAEVLESKHKEEMCLELVDVLDVVDAIMKHNNISKEELDIVRKNKYKSHGKFDSKLFIKWHELGPSGWYDHFLGNPHKYPELDID